jgi:adenosylcobinamide-phosphate synthase
VFGATRVVGVLVGYLADLVFADSRVGHPVAGFGAAATTVQRLTYRDTRRGGAVHVAILVGAVGLFGTALQRYARRYGPLGSAVVTAAATWIALGGTSLARVGSTMGALLASDDLDGARRLLPSLCGRDPALLDAAGLTRATVESIGYRAINTLDAMIGHRSPRYALFGWAAAKLDDAANYIPARVTAALTVVCAPIVGGSPSGAVTAWRRDAGRHPSPNAGVVEAAFAGALGVQLGGPTQYHYELQIRPALGAGAPPTVTDLGRAVRLSRAVQAAAALALVGLSVAVRSGR